MLHYFIRKAHPRRSLVRPRVVICVPSGITQVERRAVQESARQAGAREATWSRSRRRPPSARGCRSPSRARNMVVDIGGGTTEVAVISLSGIVHCTSIRMAGDEMNDAIVQHVRKNHGLLIGERRAEEIKLALGSAYPAGATPRPWR